MVSYQQIKQQQETIEALRDLTDQLRQQANKGAATAMLNAGITPQQAQAQLNQQTAFWQTAALQVEKGVDAAGGFRGITQEFMQRAGQQVGGGFGSLMGAAGQALGGNPMGAAAGLAGQIVGETIGPSAHFHDAYAAYRVGGGNPFDDPIYRRGKAEQYGSLAETQATADTVKPTSIRGILFDKHEQFDALADQAQGQRFQIQMSEMVKKGEADRLKEFFAPFAVGGQTPAQKDFDTVGKLFRMQAEAMAKINEMSEYTAARDEAGHPKRQASGNLR